MTAWATATTRVRRGRSVRRRHQRPNARFWRQGSRISAQNAPVRSFVSATLRRRLAGVRSELPPPGPARLPSTGARCSRHPMPPQRGSADRASRTTQRPAVAARSPPEYDASADAPSVAISRCRAGSRQAHHGPRSLARNRPTILGHIANLEPRDLDKQPTRRWPARRIRRTQTRRPFRPPAVGHCERGTANSACATAASRTAPASPSRLRG